MTRCHRGAEGAGPENGSAPIDVLRADAEAVRAASAAPARPTRTATQRALDLQDGRVLLLVEQIVRAFRQARRASTAIAMPDLEPIAWKFSSRSGKRAKKAIAASVETTARVLSLESKGT